MVDRELVGRDASPTAAIIDGESGKTTVGSPDPNRGYRPRFPLHTKRKLWACKSATICAGDVEAGAAGSAK
jgi:hypothetical protein